MRHVRPSAHERGAVLVETTLVTGMVLTLLLFSVQVGLLGFLQITSDAASFVDAHLHSVGLQPQSHSTAETVTVGAFPQIAPGDISTTPLPAPSASIPVDYHYNGSASEQSQSQNNRTGGVSMLQPTLIQSQVKPHQIFSMFGQNVGVAGTDTEPQWEECGAHYNVSNQTDLTCGGSGPSNFQVDYFTGGENTPPYYVGFNYIKHCGDPQPWTTCTSDGSHPGVDFIAFGVAEYLDAGVIGNQQPGNWGRKIAGISGSASTGQDEATFHEAACHQRVYASLATFFNNYPSLLAVYTSYIKSIVNVVGSGTTNDFSQWNEFEYTNNANSNQPDPAGHNADVATQTVYGWDEHVSQGYGASGNSQPGNYPLNPDRNCP